MSACSCPRVQTIGRASAPIEFDADCPTHGLPEKFDGAHVLNKYVRAERPYESTRSIEQRLYLDAVWPYVWYWRAKLPERKGERCRVVARGAMNSILVEFRDGTRTVTSRFAVRRAASE